MHANSTNLTDTASSATIPTLSSNVTSSNFTTNRWGYSLDGTNYIPMTTSDIAISSSSVAVNEDTSTINLATKLDLTTASGNYSNTFNFLAVANLAIYTITWDVAGGTPIPAPTEITEGAAISTVLSSLPAPTKDGFNLTGWFTAADGGTQISTATTVNSNVTYYARWEKLKTLSEITNMQEMTSATCSASAENETKQLKDTRDNKLYWVTKLKDGNCWMTQNLDYDIKATDNEVANTDGTTTTWDANPTYTSENEWYWDYATAESYDPGDNYIPNGTGYATSAEDLSADSPELHYHQGNYYNWYAATAGSNADDFEDGEDAPQSICPKGWRLPYSGYEQTGSKSWYYLVDQAGLNATNIAASPVYIPRAGGYDGSVYGIGSIGGYWSSTAGGWGDACLLAFGSAYVNPQSYGYANDSGSVRCVAL